MPLTTLILEATTPPTINENTFSNINHSTTITIPEGCKGAYLSDPNWKYLLNLTSGKVDGTIGYEQNLTWTLTFADSTLTISGTGKMDYISSEESWEAYKDYIATVIIKDGVTSIASNAFYNHRNLKEITIPNSVTSIESYAFNETAIYNNENNWTNGILYIGDCLIDTNYDLNGNYVIIPGTRIIANGAFANKNITGITIPNSVKAIGEEAFFKCQALTTINVQATTPPTISYSTFIGISSSVIITIPEDCETAYTADQNWRMLIDMTTGKVTGTIGYEQKLTWTLTFADSTLTISGTGSMEYIDYETSWKRFYPSIATVVIKDGVASIAHGAFSSHSNLREITIPNSVINIGNGAFNETAIYNNENNWTNGGLYIKNCLVATREWEMDETGYFTIADGTRLIADEAFSYNSRLTTITIPNSVTHIGNRILYGCGNITSINVLATTPPVITSSTFEGVSTGIQVTIPEGSTALYEADTNWNNFLGFCSGILSGTCGENLTWTLILADNTLNISGTGEMADYEGNNPQPWQQYRSYINTINIADGVTSIGTNAFANCYNLTNINIPNSINHIGANALWNTQLYYDKSKWTNGVLYINNCLIKASNEASGDYTIVEGTRIIADDAFYDYYESDSLTSIILPNSITHIGKRAFYNRQIENVHIGSGTQFIGDEAFAYCENLSVINVAAATPPVITDQTFYRISTNLQITVPAGSESLYLADPNWKRLFDIASGVVEGVCGDHLTWVLNLADSTLTISGYGDMYDYDHFHR